jgi:hypothetical protein
MRAARDIDAQPLPGIAYTARPDATAEAELSALANVYRYVLNKNAAGMTSTNGTSVRHMEGVGDVGERPD